MARSSKSRKASSPIHVIEYAAQSVAIQSFFHLFLERLEQADKLGLVDSPMALGRIAGCLEDFAAMVNDGDRDAFVCGHIESHHSPELDAILGVEWQVANS